MIKQQSTVTNDTNTLTTTITTAINTTGVTLYNTSADNTITYNYGSYQTLELPRNDIPVRVFAYGGMLTLGILGSRAEVAYDGDNSIIFSPGVIDFITFDRRSTLSIEYKEEIYHYYITRSTGKNIEVELISVIQK